MSPNDEVVTLQLFDGFTSYSWISPILLVCLAAISVSALTAGLSRTISLSIGIVGSALLVFLGSSAVIGQNLSGVAKQIESATGIAATHGVTGLFVETTQLAYLSLGTFALMGLIFLVAAITHHRWPSRIRKSGNGMQKSFSESTPQDAISLWDEQR